MASSGVVLAAGSSVRMGTPKQLLSVGGRPMLEGVVRAVCESSLDDVLVVLGANATAIRDAVSWGRARVVENPDHAEGMSSSLRVAVAALGAEVERFAVVLGDQVGVTAALVDRLLATQADSMLPLAALRRDGVLQPPAVVARELWGEVAALRGDVGLRGVLRRAPGRVAAVDAAGFAVMDVDTPDDHRRLTP